MTPQTDNINAIRQLIEFANNILVTAHMDGDGDSIGTQLAVLDYLESLGKNAIAAHASDVPDMLRFLPKSARLHNIRISAELEKVECAGPYDLLLVLECPTPERMGAVWNLKAADAKIINIDHHHDNVGYGDIAWVDPVASSVGELLTEYFIDIGFEFDAATAESLYTAILTDTGRFQYNSAGPKTFRLVADLVARGIDIRKVVDHIYLQRKPSSLTLLGLALATIRFFAGGRAALIEIPPATFQQAGATSADCEGIVEYTLMAKGTEVGALVRSDDNQRTKVSLRSRGGCDVSAIASQFGGGGHAGAAGCAFDASTSDVVKTIISSIETALESHVAVGVES